jgi:hypothetical protein
MNTSSSRIRETEYITDVLSQSSYGLAHPSFFARCLLLAFSALHPPCSRFTITPPSSSRNPLSFCATCLAQLLTLTLSDRLLLLLTDAHRHTRTHTVTPTTGGTLPPSLCTSVAHRIAPIVIPMNRMTLYLGPRSLPLAARSAAPPPLLAPRALSDARPTPHLLRRASLPLFTNSSTVTVTMR